MRITLCSALKRLGAQLLITAVLGTTAIAFGAGVANAAHGAVAPAPARGHTSAAGSAHWRRVGPWPGYGFAPYIVAPAPTDSAEEQDATWPPTGESWPPGGNSGASPGSGRPIVMPHELAKPHSASTTPPVSAQ
jgi:hypothetical protein